MTPALHRVGADNNPLIIVDDASGRAGELVEIAAAMAPFPPAAAGNYPGLRRFIGDDDTAASAYVDDVLGAVVDYVGAAFDTDGFTLDNASFSMVTLPPDALAPQQRAPHFDSVDRGYLALLHYLGGTEGTGTAFFRHRSTGIETVGRANVDRFVAASKRETASARGYINGGNDAFEEIARVEARPDRLIIYRGAMLHSGLIAPDAPLDPDPRRGRLTANFFLKTNPRAA